METIHKTSLDGFAEEVAEVAAEEDEEAGEEAEEVHITTDFSIRNKTIST